MRTFNKPTSSEGGGAKILLTGDISRAFSDAGDINKPGWEVCANMLDAIDAAAKHKFAAIAVVMSGSVGILSSALKALKASNRDARIILLAQMYEEPAAMQLVGSSCDGRSLADDYMICPVDFSYLVSRVLHLVEGTPEASGDISAAAREVAELVEPVEAGREMKMKRLEELATTDDLTGLKNRRYIREFSRQIIGQAKRENGRVTLLMFDIDNFKHYNDVYGHSAGDEILRQAAVLMRRCCRGHDVVGRVGGDEFAVVFWDDPRLKRAVAESERRSAMAEHPREAIFIAKRFRRELNSAKLHSLGPEGKGVLTISGGLASFPRDGSTVEELFRQVDEALLDAKRSGKNRIYLVGRPQSDISEIE